MKKRLLSLLLVAFVLCTMAINCFADVNKSGEPIASTFACARRVFGQFNWQSNNYQSNLFYYDTCQTCGGNITVINVEITVDNYDLIDFENSCVAVGSYYTYNRYGFKPSNYILKPFVDGTGCGASTPYTDITQIYLQPIVKNGNFVFMPYVHYRMDIVSTGVQGGWYFCIFDKNQNAISKSMYQNAVNWRNDYSLNKTKDLYEGRQMNWLITHFVTPEYSELTSDLYQSGYKKGYDNGYDEGYSIGEYDGHTNGFNQGYNDGLLNGEYGVGYEDGEAAGYENGYTDGHTDGTIKGQEMSNWSFSDLIDGVLKGAGNFIQPFFSLGYRDITIGSIISLLGIAYVSMFVLKIVRG